LLSPQITSRPAENKEENMKYNVLMDGFFISTIESDVSKEETLKKVHSLITLEEKE